MGLAFGLIRLEYQWLAVPFICGVLGCNTYIIGKYFNGAIAIVDHKLCDRLLVIEPKVVTRERYHSNF